jgi:hypothetical protein
LRAVRRGLPHLRPFHHRHASACGLRHAPIDLAVSGIRHFSPVAGADFAFETTPGLNQRPSDYKSDALPTELIAIPQRRAAPTFHPVLPGKIRYAAYSPSRNVLWFFWIRCLRTASIKLPKRPWLRSLGHSDYRLTIGASIGSRDRCWARPQLTSPSCSPGARLSTLRVDPSQSLSSFRPSRRQALLAGGGPGLRGWTS